MLRQRFVGVTDLRDSIRELLDEVVERDVIVLRHNQPVAVLVHPERIERLITRIEDLEDYVAVLEHRLNPDDIVKHDDVMAHLDEDSRFASG
jgi:prevent-host-death family protein